MSIYTILSIEDFERFEKVADARRKADVSEMTVNFFMHLIQSKKRRFTPDDRKQIRLAYEQAQIDMVHKRRRARAIETYQEIQLRKNA